MSHFHSIKKKSLPPGDARIRKETKLDEATINENNWKMLDQKGEMMKKDLKTNRFKKDEGKIYLTEAQVYALGKLKKYYTDQSIDKNTAKSFPPTGYISNRQEVEDLAGFFFWGAWVCAVERPGSDFSYTHNWPYDPQAGNTLQAVDQRRA